MTKAVTQWTDYKLDPRYLIILFLLSFVVAGQVYLGFFQKWNAVLASVAASFLAELILSRVLLKKWKFSVSPVITGLGVSLLLSSHQVWPYVLTAFLSIAIKFAIRVKGGHLFNPNNVALVLMLYFLPEYAVSTPKQWTNGYGIMAVIVCLGFVVAYVAKRLDTVLAFLVSFAAFGLIRHYAFGSPTFAALGPLMGASLQLFVFFMITDPRTTPPTRGARIAYAVLIAMVDAGFRIEQIPNPQFYSFAIVTLCFMLPYRYWLHLRASNGTVQKSMRQEGV